MIIREIKIDCSDREPNRQSVKHSTRGYILPAFHRMSEVTRVQSLTPTYELTEGQFVNFEFIFVWHRKFLMKNQKNIKIKREEY